MSPALQYQGFTLRLSDEMIHSIQRETEPTEQSEIKTSSDEENADSGVVGNDRITGWVSDIEGIYREANRGAGLSDCLFRLARALRCLPEARTAKRATVMKLVKEWYETEAPEEITDGKPYSIGVWRKFSLKSLSIKSSPDDGPLANAIRRALEAVPPEEAEMYGDADMSLLVALCRELQANAGHNPFPLPVRVAAKAIGVKRLNTVWEMLKTLVSDGILEEVSTGLGYSKKSLRPKKDRANKCTTWRYLPSFRRLDVRFE